MNHPLTYQIDKVLYFFSLSRIVLPNGTTIEVIEPFGSFESKKIITSLFPEFQDDPTFYNNYKSILEKLEKDGFLKINEKKIEHPSFQDGSTARSGVVTQKEGIFITFEGRIWLEQNAYAGQLARSNEVEIRNRNSYNLNWILGIGAVVVGIGTLFQCFDYYDKHPNLDFQKCAYFSAGTGLGILISLSVWITLRILRKK